MRRFIARRLIYSLVTLAMLSITIFGLVRLTGDPARLLAGPGAQTEDVEALREQLGLNEPLLQQFTDWSLGVLRLDFGESLFIGKPVTEALLERAEPTGLLTLYSLIFALLAAVPSGVIAAMRPNSLLDRLLMVTSISGAAIPSFFFGILLMLFFAVRLGWLPSGGYEDVSDGFWQHFRYMIMPSIALGFSAAGLLARIIRSTMLDVLNQEYIRTAYAKGLIERRVVMRHALRNAMIPALTLIGIMLANMLGGAVVIETVFNIPGMGRLLVQSVVRRDFPVVQAAVLVVAVIEVLVMLLVDILYVFADPRIRYGGE